VSLICFILYFCYYCSVLLYGICVEISSLLFVAVRLFAIVNYKCNTPKLIIGVKIHGENTLDFSGNVMLYEKVKQQFEEKTGTDISDTYRVFFDALNPQLFDIQSPPELAEGLLKARILAPQWHAKDGTRVFKNNQVQLFSSMGNTLLGRGEADMCSSAWVMNFNKELEVVYSENLYLINDASGQASATTDITFLKKVLAQRRM